MRVNVNIIYFKQIIYWQIIKQRNKNKFEYNSSRMSKNFIHKNIQNIKGARKPPSMMED
jgi:hypothetical protein